MDAWQKLLIDEWEGYYLPHLEDSIRNRDFESDLAKGLDIMEELTLGELFARIIALEERIDALEQAVDRCAGQYHEHDEYASAREVERMGRTISDQTQRLERVEYATDEAKRDVERHTNDSYKHGNRY